ncbi:hypothetical protein M0R45_000087 [Rubus argutus]|uniref:CCHC-type domain-containing protein n=1 Tax=Rubus argutus TaxID=59490 RepID=A0AAW1VQ61_RUBAR
MLRDTRTYFNCGQAGHVQNNCPQLRMYQAPAVPQQYRAPAPQYYVTEPQYRAPQPSYRALNPPPQNWARQPVGQPMPRIGGQPAAVRPRPQVGAKKQNHLIQGRVYAIGYGENEVNNGNQVEATGQFQMANQLVTAGLNSMEDPYDHAVVEGPAPDSTLEPEEALRGPP